MTIPEGELGFRPVQFAGDPAQVQEPIIPGEQKTDPVAPSYDFKQFGDEFDTPESVKAFIESSREVHGKVKTYEEELSSLKSRPIYADEALYKLDQVKRIAPDKFDVARNLLFGNISDLDAIRLSQEYEDPILKDLDPEDKQAYFDSKYNLSHGLKALKEEDGFTEEEVRTRNEQIAVEERRIRTAKVAMSIDAGRARKVLEEKIFAGIEVPKIETREEVEKRQAEAVTRLAEAWKEPLAKLSGIKSIRIDTWDAKEDKAKPAFEMQIPEPALKGYLEELNANIVKYGWTPDQVSVADAQAFIEDRFRMDNLPKIIREESLRARNMSNEEWQNYIFNPQRPANPVVVPPSGGSVRNTNDSFRRAIDKA